MHINVETRSNGTSGSLFIIRTRTIHPVTLEGTVYTALLPGANQCGQPPLPDLLGVRCMREGDDSSRSGLCCARLLKAQFTRIHMSGPVISRTANALYRLRIGRIPPRCCREPEGGNSRRAEVNALSFYRSLTDCERYV
jgi:hypothetical protein